MPIPRIYKEQTCDLEGYEELSVRLLMNPTGRELRDWQEASLGTPDCKECQALREGTGADSAVYCPSCTAERERKGRAAVVLFGPTLLERPCTTVAEALAILDSEDYPAEIIWWLFVLPDKAISARQKELMGNLLGSATTPNT